MSAQATLPADPLAALMARLAQVEAGQAALTTEVADLRARLEPKPREASPADVALHRLLCIHVEPFGRDFLAAEVVEAFEVDGPLRSAVVAAVGNQRRGRAHRLGKWFRRLEGMDMDGLRLARRPDHHSSARWRFELVDGST